MGKFICLRTRQSRPRERDNIRQISVYSRGRLGGSNETRNRPTISRLISATAFNFGCFRPLASYVTVTTYSDRYVPISSLGLVLCL